MGTNGSTSVERKEIEKEGFEEKNLGKNLQGSPVSYYLFNFNFIFKRTSCNAITSTHRIHMSTVMLLVQLFAWCSDQKHLLVSNSDLTATLRNLCTFTGIPMGQ